jgi:hypothetical protein
MSGTSFGPAGIDRTGDFSFEVLLGSVARDLLN